MMPLSLMYASPLGRVGSKAGRVSSKRFVFSPHTCSMLSKSMMVNPTKDTPARGRRGSIHADTMRVVAVNCSHVECIVGSEVSSHAHIQVVPSCTGCERGAPVKHSLAREPCHANRTHPPAPHSAQHRAC